MTGVGRHRKNYRQSKFLFGVVESLQVSFGFAVCLCQGHKNNNCSRIDYPLVPSSKKTPPSSEQYLGQMPFSPGGPLTPGGPSLPGSPSFPAGPGGPPGPFSPGLPGAPSGPGGPAGP